jgi:hypothetical protein
MTKLDDKARELGFTIKKGPTKFSGYILKRLNVAKQAAAKSNRARKGTVDHLIDDEELAIAEYESQVDEYPIGSDYKWSLAEIEDYLESIAADIAAGRVKQDDDSDEPEVETGVKRPKVKPPAPATISKALRGHESADEIRAMAKSAKVADQQSGPTLHDLNLEVRALKSRDEFNPNWNNIGGHEYNEHDEKDDRDLKQYLEDEKRIRENFEKYSAPEKGTPDFAAPKAATRFEVAKIGRRIARSELPKRRTLLEIATVIRVAIAKGDKAAAGKLLIEAKEGTLDHGEFTQWAEHETGLTSRTCRNYMTMAQNGK